MCTACIATEQPILSTHGKGYRSGDKRLYRGKIKDRRCIETRPIVVNERQRIGNWEVDSIVGAMHKSAVAQAIINRMSANNLLVYTISGTEFTRHAKIAEALNIDFYFTHPYSSWEKGTNENINSLIREYFLKGTDFSTVSTEMLGKVEEELNKRPRKWLGYQTPAEVLELSKKPTAAFHG